MNKRSSKHFWIIISIFVLALAAIARFSGVIINTSSSMPVGLYIKHNGSIQRNDIVLVCLPIPYREIALKRKYLEHGGICNGIDPVIKQVLAIPGDYVVLTNKFIEVNHKRYNYITKQRDRVGRLLISYPRSKFYTNGYWVFGTNNPNSWDSRYWGPINKKQIISNLHLVWSL